jgi:predicted TIM-barrel fold metal-dependent hydrolase
MIKLRSTIVLISLVFAFAIVSAQPRGQSDSSQKDAESSPAKSELQALAGLEPIDTHTHVAKGDADFYAMLDRLHMHILDIVLVDDHEEYRKSLGPQVQDALRVVHESHGHAALCTSIDPFQFGQPDFPNSAIRGLDRDFADGAVAVKIWKNIGMELMDKDGHYVLADNPAFEPIYRDIQKHNKTLVAHQAEPDEAWAPPNPNGLDYSYYKENPVWYMYEKPEAPKKQQILDARDHLLKMNPKLRVVGAHLGSSEDDLDGLGERFDRYPNFATDTAARVVHLVVQPSDKVRAFIVKYQDRLVYGTDLGVEKTGSIPDAIKEWEEQYAQDWRYFATRDNFDYEGHKTQGLGLPPEVLRKLYHANAVHWIPGIVGTH